MTRTKHAARSVPSRPKASQNGHADAGVSSSSDTLADDNAHVDEMCTDVHPNRDDAYNISESSSAAIGSISTEPNKLLDAINDIAMLGIENSALELPKIVTIGDQSAGKSSAIAAISGITVPRKAGMCTRCPSHINLKRSRASDAPWSCTISLEKKFSRSMGKWERQEGLNLVELARVSSSDELEALLERAQLASLNPDKEATAFMTCDKNDLPTQNTADLSPNLVRLDIESPKCPNLTFYDLPGIFNQTAKRDQGHLVHEIREMVMEYIEPEANIILLACAMENDIENSSAASLVGAATYRSIGLLTKADRLPEGYPTASWRSILAGEHFKLGHGYFVTKQPSQRELDQGTDHERARKLEEIFFRTQQPWCTEFSQFQNQFGIPRLQAKLSDLLVAHIRSCLPRLKEQVNQRLESIEAKMNALPVPPGDRALSIISKMMTEFQSKLEKHMKGELPHNQFINEWLNGVAQSFQKDLHDMRPTLIIRSTAETEEIARIQQQQQQQSFSSTSSRHNEEDVINISDTEMPVTPTPSRKRQQNPQLAPSSAAKRLRSTPSSSASNRQSKPPSRTSVKHERETIDLYTNLPTTDANGASKFRIDEVRDIRRSMNTSAVVGMNDHRADEFLIQKAVERWREPLDRFVDSTTQKLQDLLGSVCEELLHGWKTTPISIELPKFVFNFVKGTSDRHREIAKHYLEAEQLQPATLNSDSMRHNIQQETKIFREARRKARAILHLEQTEAKTGKFTSGEEREEKLKKVSDSQLEEDEFATEVEAMGRVRGYYNVASANFVDTIVKYMRLDIFSFTRTELVKALEKHFKIYDRDGFEFCQTLLMEDPRREEERRSLMREREKFRQAKVKLDSLDMPNGSRQEY